jgi:hypothetical protein
LLRLEEKHMSLTFRLATPDDAATIRQFMIDLSGSQGAPLLPSVETLRRQLEELKPPFECLLAEINQRPVGFALFPDLLYSIAAIRQGKEAHVFTWKTGV